MTASVDASSNSGRRPAGSLEARVRACRNQINAQFCVGNLMIFLILTTRSQCHTISMGRLLPAVRKVWPGLVPEVIDAEHAQSMHAEAVNPTHLIVEGFAQVRQHIVHMGTGLQGRDKNTGRAKNGSRKGPGTTSIENLVRDPTNLSETCCVAITQPALALACAGSTL